MNTCKKMTQLMSQRLDRRLNTIERIQLRLHLVICAGCQNFDQNMRQLREVLSCIGIGGEPADRVKRGTSR